MVGYLWDVCIELFIFKAAQLLFGPAGGTNEKWE